MTNFVICLNNLLDHAFTLLCIESFGAIGGIDVNLYLDTTKLCQYNLQFVENKLSILYLFFKLLSDN